MASWKVGGGEVHLLSTVHGLLAERERVVGALHTLRPEVLAIGLSPESVASLLHYERDPEVDPLDELTDHDHVYSLKLREYGDVELPPAELVAALRWAKEKGVPFFGVDLPEERYEDMFTKEVSVWGFLRMGRLQRSLARRPPKAKDARSFSIAWDTKMRRVKGIRVVEAAREAAIAEGAASLARDGGRRVLLLVEAAREAGVRERLGSLG